MWLSPAGAEPGNILPDGAAPQAHVVPAGRGHAAHPALLAATAILAPEQPEQVRILGNVHLLMIIMIIGHELFNSENKYRQKLKFLYKFLFCSLHIK